MNNHETIKYDTPQYNERTKSCHFLDLHVVVNNNLIETDIYRKPTDHPSALLPSSSHPKHTTKNIIYTMAFRLLRICSNPETLNLRLKELKSTFLILRGYKSIEIDIVSSKILTLDRKNVLQNIMRYQKDTDNDVFTVPLTHDPRLPNQGRIIRTHYNAMIINNQKISSKTSVQKTTNSRSKTNA